MGRACDGSAQDDALKGADHSFQLAGLMQCHSGGTKCIKRKQPLLQRI
jgi:hypothetical protein